MDSVDMIRAYVVALCEGVAVALCIAVVIALCAIGCDARKDYSSHNVKGFRASNVSRLSSN